MPTYDYIREDGEVFEHYQSINSEPLETCPETGQKVKRLISGGHLNVPHGMNTQSASTMQMKRNPHNTTSEYYRKKIDANTEKARKIKYG